MEIKRITCPSCGILLDVKNSKNEAVKLIHCPQCKVPLQVKFGTAPVEDNGKTRPVNDGDTHKTHLLNEKSSSSNSSDDTLHRQTPYLECNGQRYKLAMGINIVGRKASTSNATVQIDTNDRYMSRMHARIQISLLPTGQIRATITNERNMNTTLLNEQPLSDNDVMILTKGSRIQMGDTTVIYTEKSN